MSTLKIGFHGGPGGNHTGIGEYYQRLDAAGIPFVLKSVDHYGHCYEASQYNNANHVIVFRLSTSGQNDGYDYDVPRYDLDPIVAADLHWQKTLAKLPPEFNKEKVWLEVINEVDKNAAEWLAQFAMAIADFALADGYRIALFGWSSGEPEIDHWRGPFMLEFLTMASVHPDEIAIALHEYSYTVDNIYDGYPYKVGRYKFLHEVCDKNNIPRPTILITEWGWTLNDVPEPTTALVHIDTIAKEYALHQNILGAAIWYLGGDFENIADKAQRLIIPVTEQALNVVYPDPIDPPSGGTTVKIKKNDIISSRGWAGWTVGGAKIRAIYNDGSDNVISEWVAIEIPDTPIDDLRGVELSFALSKEIEVQTPTPVPPPVPVIWDLVDELPKHDTLTYSERSGGEDDITVITIHHTVSGATLADITAIANYHINTNGWPGIAYHYCITADGEIYQTNRLITKSFHSGGNNHYSIGIALLGDFTSQPPTSAQLTSCATLVDYLRDEKLNNVDYVWPHKGMPAAETQCPGNTSGDWWTDAVPPFPVIPPSVKFNLGDVVAVTSASALNLRSTPFGSVKGSYPTGTQMTVSSTLSIQATGYIWWQVSVGSEIGWVAEDYIDPASAGGQKYDMTTCYLPSASSTHSDILIRKNNWGQGDERCQIIVSSGKIYLTKGSNYEQYSIHDGAIYYEADTSINDTDMIKVSSPEGWVAGEMAIGQKHTAVEDVTVLDKGTCAVKNQYSGTFIRQLANVHDSYTIPESGFVYSDVRELWWVDGAGNWIERHWFAPGLPRLRWENNEGRVSWVSEHISLGDQGNNTISTVC